MRGVVRKVLADAAREGLPGEHHFYITFRTQAPGVRLSDRLREQYPNEMTIILQYQFWDLQVDEEGFDVGLHFKNIPERLHVPFEAITGFYDPSVQFGLKFELTDEEDAIDEDAEEVEETAPGPVANLPRAAPEAEKPKPRGAGSEPAVVHAKAASAEPARGKPAKAQSDKIRDDKPPKAAEQKPAAPAPAAESDGSKVVSIDAFRKKT